jgi:hypothetical protein
MPATDSKGRTIRVGARVALATSITGDTKRFTRGNGTPIPPSLIATDRYDGCQAVVASVLQQGLAYDFQPKAPDPRHMRIQQDKDGNDVLGPDGKPVIVHQTIDQYHGWEDGSAKVRVEIEDQGCKHLLWCLASEITVVGQSAPKA